MNTDKVIEVLETEIGCAGTDEIYNEAITQAISMIKENEALKKYIDKMKKGFIPANVEDGCYRCKLKAENGELKEDNSYVASWMDKVHELEIENDELKYRIETLLRQNSKYFKDSYKTTFKEYTELKAKYEELEKENNTLKTHIRQGENGTAWEQVKKLQQELADLKKAQIMYPPEVPNSPDVGEPKNERGNLAVASEGLGVEEIAKVIGKYFDENKVSFDDYSIAEAIHEAQTKYKKELKEER